jgi:hypothetical protein
VRQAIKADVDKIRPLRAAWDVVARSIAGIPQAHVQSPAV